MNEEIINKLHVALYPISPLASDRDRIIEQMGETIWLESLEKTLLALDETKRGEVVSLLNNNELDKAVEIVEASGIDIEAIISGVSVDILETVINSTPKKV
jgi:hypothetical protein